MMLDIDLSQRNTFEPGEPIDVGVKWDLHPAPTELQLRFVWNTSGKGTQDIQVADRVVIESPPAMDQRRIALTLPREPYSFSGRLLSISWALELVALPSETATRTEIVIAPNGQEVLAMGRSE